MLSGFLIGLREGLEAALIVGLTLGVLSKMGRQQYRTTVWAGVAAAIIISLITAGFLNILGASLEGSTEEVFEGLMMFLAAGVLSWMILWMHRQARHIQEGMESDIRQAVQHGHRSHTDRAVQRGWFERPFTAWAQLCLSQLSR